MSTFNMEYLLEAAIGIIGGFAIYIWKANVRSIEKLEASFDAQVAGLKAYFDTQMTELKKVDKDRRDLIWNQIRKSEADITEIKEMRGSYAAELKNIEQRMSQIPTHGQICDMLRESEARIEERIMRLFTAVKK